MSYRALGDSGPVVSAVGIGCNAFSRRVDQAGVDEILAAARDTGVTFLDTADVYGEQFGRSEEMLGHALAGQRDEFVVATKFGRGHIDPEHGPGGSPRYVVRAVEASLRRLGTDRIDLFQYHLPDGVTPVAETLQALTGLVQAGKVLHVGCSNLRPWEVVDAEWTSRTSGLVRFVSSQFRYSLLDRGAEAEMVPVCARFGIGVLPYFPLARGLLTGKYHQGRPAPVDSRAVTDPGPSAWLDKADWPTIDALRGYAEARGVSLLDVAIAWLAAQPTVGSVICGVTSASQVRANAAALRWQPTAADLAELDRLTGMA